MYDRAERKFTFQSSVGTSFNIGPGSYEHFSTIHSKSDAYAPFQSLALRDFNFNHEDAVNIPGPSQYYSKLLRNKIPGGSSVSNTDSRFKPLRSDNPGPGQYCVEDVMKCHSVVADRTDKASLGAVEKSRVAFRRVEQPPSIPHAKTAFGYEEGPHGVLVKQGPPQRDTTIGPAFYDPRTGNTLTTDKYKGCFWSYDRARRSDFSGAPGPGPGEYEPFGDHWAEMAAMLQAKGEIGAGDKAQLKLPRFIDDIQQKAIRDHVPGPASYNHSGLIECHKPLYNEAGERIVHPPFGCQAKRFNSNFNAFPGPGSYNDPRTALGALSKVTGMKRSPFGITATRFTNCVDMDVPGPQVYNLPEESPNVKNSYISFTKKGGFGSTSIRDADLGGKNSQGVPGPSHYQPKPSSGASKPPQQMSSMFASLTNRDYDAIGKGGVPDASYDVVTSFKSSQGKKVYTEPRTKEAKRRHCSFMSHASRYSKGSPLDCVDPSLPGPSTYDTKSYLNTRTGKFYFREKRFAGHIDDTPGPGQYEIKPAGSTCAEKCEFNVTLGSQCLLHRKPVNSYSSQRRSPTL